MLMFGFETKLLETKLFRIQVKARTDEAKDVIEHYKRTTLPKTMKFLRSAETRDLWVIIDSELEYLNRKGYRRVLPDPFFTKFQLQNRNCLLREWIESGLGLKDLTWESVPGGKPKENSL